MNKEIQLSATDDNLMVATQFAEDALRECGFSEKKIMETTLALEEIFVNISHYAYNPEQGDVVIRYDYSDNIASITFIDSGKPYNPLANDDPDITLSAEDRDIGGLGIFLSKKLTNGIQYHREGNKNTLTICKNNE